MLISLGGDLGDVGKGAGGKPWVSLLPCCKVAVTPERTMG